MKLTNKTPEKPTGYYKIGQAFWDKKDNEVAIIIGYGEQIVNLVYTSGQTWDEVGLEVFQDVYNIPVKEFNDWLGEFAEDLIPITIEEIIYREG